MMDPIEVVISHIDRWEWHCDECDGQLGPDHIRHGQHFFCSALCAFEYADRYGDWEGDQDIETVNHEEIIA